MKIFDKRPLCLILCITLGSFVLFTYCSFYTLIIPTIFLILSFIKPISRILSTNFSRLLSLLSLIAVLLSFVYFNLYFPAYNRFDDDSNIIIGTVLNIEENSNTKKVTLKTDSINNQIFSSYKLYVYLNKEEFYNYSIGSKIEITGRIEKTPSSGLGESYYISKGISGIIRDVNGYKMIEVGDYPLEYKITSYRKALSRDIILKTNKEVGGLLAALLLGEREYLTPQINLDFLRLGITHVLALSGTHLVILSIGLSKLLMKLGVNKKIATIAAILFTIFYMAITGFSASVTRAGIMLIISSMLFLMSSSHDSMTSLFLSVGVMCIITPYSIFDIGLWLSAFATLGILIMGEYSTEKNKSSFVRSILITFLATFFALATTAFITFLKFDATSLMSAPATLIFSILTEIFIYIGILLVFIGNFTPIRNITIFIGNITIDLAAYMAEIKSVYISSNFTCVKIVTIIFTVLLIVFLIINIKHKKMITTILFFMLISIFVLSTGLTHCNASNTEFVYENFESENIIIKDNEKITFFDISTYDETAAYNSYNRITENKLVRIDNYVTTHYSYLFEEYLYKLLGMVEIKNLYIPSPSSEAEEEIYERITEISPSFRVNIIFYEDNKFLKLDNSEMNLIFRSSVTESKKLIFILNYSTKVYTYTTTSMFSGNTKGMTRYILANSNAIIFGSHSQDLFELKDKFVLADTVIFSNQNIKMHIDIYEYYSEKKMYMKADRLSFIH